MRRDHTRTPPKPSSEISAKVPSSANRDGSGEAGGMIRSLYPHSSDEAKAFVGGTANRGHTPLPGWRSFIMPGSILYSACWRESAMAINGRRNKPFGPGGSTRRLHHQGSVVISQ